MKVKYYTWLCVLTLLVIPVGSTWACGNAQKSNATQNRSCAKEDHNTMAKACCTSEDTDTKSCDGQCDHASCHCSVSINNTIVAYHTPTLMLSYGRLYAERQWSYLSGVPKSIYFAIWQPPKIG